MSQLTLSQALDQALKHHSAGRLREAETLYRRILAVTPEPDALHGLGVIAYRAGKLDAAADLVSQAIAQAPRVGFYHNTLGEILRAGGQLDRAMECYRRSLTLQPNFPEAYNNMGIVHAHRCELELAIQSFTKAIQLRPDYAEANDGLGIVQLTSGQLQQGWRHSEWRWRKADFPSRARNFPQPQWDGSDLAGRTLLIHAEQGFGDTIQFCRYIPLLSARGHKVIFECQPDVYPLIRNSPGFDTLIPSDQPLPPFDLHCPLLSVPLMMGTELNTIPASVPYLYPLPHQVEQWRATLSADPAPLKVGLAWAGLPVHSNDRNRSCSLADLAPLASVPGVSFYSLQKGEAAKQLQSTPPGMKLFDAGQQFNNFADTAALIACLDLVIAVDTSVVHVAGALARPVWTLLPFGSEWRWMLNRSDTPWYPTMRLFRQTRRGDWASVIPQTAQALAQFISQKS